MSDELLDILPTLRNKFRIPLLNKVPGGASPRTLITDALVDSFCAIVEIARPNLILEIGAYEASFSCEMKRRLPTADVWAFEANPHVFSVFKENKLINAYGVKYINAAVSENTGEVELIIPTSIKSVTKPLTNRMGSLNHLRISKSESTRIRVPSINLDSYLAPIEGKSLAMWIDVEGAVDRVLSGASLTMSQVEVVLCELETAQVWVDQLTDNALIARFKDWQLIPVLCDCQTQSQYNVILIKESLLNNVEIRTRVELYPGIVRKILDRFVQ
jgi:FkbM family methyltransferase